MGSAHTEPRWAQQHLWQIRPFRDLMWVAGVVFLIYAGYTLLSVLMPIILALLLTYLFSPLVDRAERRSVPRWVSLVVIIFLLILAVAGLWVWLGPLLFKQFSELLAAIPEFLRSVAAKQQIELGGVDKMIEDLVEKLRASPMETLRPVFSGTVDALTIASTFVSKTVYWLLTAALVPIYFFFFALSLHPVTRRIERYIPQSKRQPTGQIMSKMNYAVSVFLRGRLVISLIMAAMFAFGWSPVVTDVPFWLILGILTGLLAIIPYAAVLGWFAALIFKSVDLAAAGGATQLDWVLGLGGLSLVYGVVQLIEGWLLTPWIQGRAMDLSPVTVIIVVFIGGSVAGLWGMILAIPVAACIKIFLVDVAFPAAQQWARSH